MHVSPQYNSLHLMFQTMLPLRLHEFQSQTSAYWVSYKTFKSLTLALVGRDNTGCACIIAPVHGICLHYITQRCYYAIQSIQPSTDRTHTYIHVYIYIIAEHLPMAHQYEATLGSAHTEHVPVHVLNVHSPIHKHYTATYMNTYCKASLQ